MKTPRELLLARHRAAEPKLDAIRRATVATLRDGRTPAKRQTVTSIILSLVLRLIAVPWRELILPSRRLWTGLATIWILLLIINVCQRDPASSNTEKSVQAPAVMMSWQVQQRWMNEVLADRSTPADADRPRNLTPRPRTEKHQLLAA